ncbi:glycerate kinase [hot springs metagenome]|uniref:glycerate 2-kinase n=1 Tax=hot springs metagenome TaxID=433727 RepID=A0A5J4KYL1_9ZZZZ
MERDRNDLATEIFYAALKAVDPYNAVRLYTDKIRSIYQGGNFNRLIVIAFGKAACPMAKAVEDELGDLIDTGIAITKSSGKEETPLHPSTKGEGTNSPCLFTPSPLHHFTLFNAKHPVPDKSGLKAADEVIKLIKDTDEKTLVPCLISGGGSALLVSPYKGISLDEKQKITQLLLKSGADIYELNTVRKHISKVKGGRLAEIAYPAMVISLILSDVIGDRLDVIASGPTAPDRTTFRDALMVLDKYGLIDIAPENVIKLLQKGAEGLIKETPKDGDLIFKNVDNIIIASNRKALEAAKARAEGLGFNAEIISSEITGEAREVGKWLADIARAKCSNRSNRSTCLISGGETTVTVKGNGKGGRNMELAIAFAMEIEGIKGITLLSAGTDGTDGPTDAAGAIVDGETIKKARAMGLNPEEYLDNNDSYNFFKKTDELYITGPTGTNVMDIQIVIIEK